MRVPRSTYRLQLNADFRLADVIGLLDYFQSLGISDLYLSPLLQARAGSPHGYDVIDPGHLNREVGTEAEFEQLAAELNRRDMGILLDIVPNHMSATEANPWWRDLMEHGPASLFADFFDIDWTADPASPRLALPFLGRELAECVASGELQLVVQNREVAIAYFDRRLPIDAASIPTLVAALQRETPAGGRESLDDVAMDARALPARTDAAQALIRRRHARQMQNRLADALEQSRAPLTLPAERLLELLDRQAYTLVYWVPGGRLINYRRFFDVSELAGLRTELPDVFAALHQRIIPWLREGTIGGVRIDHIDGLHDPEGYLRQLRKAAGTHSYVVVEKILTGDEQLPAHWETAGTTGYDFLAAVNGLFVEPGGWETLGMAYHESTEQPDFTAVLRDKKRQVLATLFPGELRSLVHRLQLLVPDAAPAALEFALAELTACLPVYRTYIDSAVAESDYGVIDEALNAIRAHGVDAALVGWLRSLLLEPHTAAQFDFIQRWQQLSGPVMAKGLEDTAFYNYHRLVSTCEVGCDPRRAWCSIEQFHQKMLRRHTDSPHTLNTTSTHDTKRSEDVRARINVLSELADEWIDCLHEWRTLHARFRRRVQDLEVPAAGMEWLLYQTLAGVWPLEAPDATFEKRITEYMVKAAREAKQHTSWRAENPDYESALSTFTTTVLRADNEPFRTRFLALQQRVALFGALNSLSQLVIKLGAPGIPDFYQGCEFWSLALVDPDNRRPVDFTPRKAALRRQNAERVPEQWQDGQLKAFITMRGLGVRNQYPALFARGDYVPWNVKGQRAGNVIAFERRADGVRALFLATRFFSQLCAHAQWPCAPDWGDTELWSGERGSWHDVLTGRTLAIQDHARLATVLTRLPVAILIRTS